MIKTKPMKRYSIRFNPPIHVVRTDQLLDHFLFSSFQLKLRAFSVTSWGDLTINVPLDDNQFFEDGMVHRYGLGTARVVKSRVFATGAHFDVERLELAMGRVPEVRMEKWEKEGKVRMIALHGDQKDLEEAEVALREELEGCREMEVIRGSSGMSDKMEVLLEEPLQAKTSWGLPLMERLRNGFDEARAIASTTVEGYSLFLIFHKDHKGEAEVLERRTFRYNFPGVVRSPGLRLRFRSVRNEVELDERDVASPEGSVASEVDCKGCIGAIETVWPRSIKA